MNLGGDPISGKKDSIGGNTLITCADHKRTRRRVTWEDLNGPWTKSEEPNHSGRHASRLKWSNPTLFFYWNPSKIEPGTSPCDQSPAFQAHSLQIILWRIFRVRAQRHYWAAEESCPYSILCLVLYRCTWFNSYR